MRKILSAAAALLLGVSPALATQGSVNLASPTGSVQTTSDATATNLINIGALCGATATATLYIACANQLIINASGQALTLDSQSGTWNITNISGTISLPTGAATQTTLAAVLTALGTPMQATGGTVGLVAGTAIAGKFGIDQTTPGTTNGVVVNNTLNALVNNADGVTPVGSVTSTAGNSPVNSTNYLFNGTTLDRQRSSATNTGVALTNTPSPYPDTAIPITASATGTTGATTATLTNVTSHLTYICGFSIRANAAAAATGNATVTGTKTGTLNFTQWTAVNTSGLGVTEEVFSPCIPASAVSTSIAVVSAAPGTSGVVSVTAWGYSI